MKAAEVSYTDYHFWACVLYSFSLMFLFLSSTLFHSFFMMPQSTYTSISCCGVLVRKHEFVTMLCFESPFPQKSLSLSLSLRHSLSHSLAPFLSDDAQYVKLFILFHYSVCLSARGIFIIRLLFSPLLFSPAYFVLL